MNTNVDPNVIKEALNRIVDNIIYNDINTGKELLKKCNYSCNIIQKQQVISFITDIVSRYSTLIAIYNSLSNLPPSKKEIECSDLKNYICFLEIVKAAKKEIDNFDKCLETLGSK